jgi:hypothetical protein
MHLIYTEFLYMVHLPSSVTGCRYNDKFYRLFFFILRLVGTIGAETET